MRFKLFLFLVMLGASLFALVQWHRRYTPEALEVKLPDAPPSLMVDPTVLQHSQHVDSDAFKGYMLEEIAANANIFNIDRDAVEMTLEELTPTKPTAPAQYPGKVISVSVFAGGAGAIIQCDKPLPKAEKTDKLNTPKPVMAGKPAPTQTPSPTRPGQPNRLTSTRKPTQKVEYTSPYSGPRYYKVGETLADGGILKDVDFTKRAVIIHYADSDYTLVFKPSWDALAKSQEAYRLSAEKKATALKTQSEEHARKEAEAERQRRIAEYRKRREENMRRQQRQ